MLRVASLSGANGLAIDLDERLPGGVIDAVATAVGAIRGKDRRRRERSDHAEQGDLVQETHDAVLHWHTD